MTVSKITIAMAIALTFGAPAALAGPGKDCGDKKAKATQASSQVQGETQVLATSDRAEKKMKKRVYTLEEATEACSKKGADDMQACINYKTGKTQPKS